MATNPFTLTNCGTLPLTISGAVAASAVFTVPTAENGCTQPIAVGQSCTLSVRYTPTAVTNDISTLTIQSNASISETVLALTGSGVVPQIRVSNSSFDFSFTQVGQTTSGAVSSSTDAGGAPLTLNAAEHQHHRGFLTQGTGQLFRYFAGRRRVLCSQFISRRLLRVRVPATLTNCLERSRHTHHCRGSSRLRRIQSAPVPADYHL